MCDHRHENMTIKVYDHKGVKKKKVPAVTKRYRPLLLCTAAKFSGPDPRGQVKGDSMTVCHSSDRQTSRRRRREELSNLPTDILHAQHLVASVLISWTGTESSLPVREQPGSQRPIWETANYFVCCP